MGCEQQKVAISGFQIKSRWQSKSKPREKTLCVEIKVAWDTRYTADRQTPLYLASVIQSVTKRHCYQQEPARKTVYKIDKIIYMYIYI